MMKVTAIGLAGLIGTLARYWMSGWIDNRFGATFPAGTLLVNLAGCFAAGFLFHALSEKYVADPALRSIILVGLLGGFTTLSSYGVQTFTLLRDSEFLLAAVNVVATNAGALAGVWAGYALSRIL